MYKKKTLPNKSYLYMYATCVPQAFEEFINRWNFNSFDGRQKKQKSWGICKFKKVGTDASIFIKIAILIADGKNHFQLFQSIYLK